MHYGTFLPMMTGTPEMFQKALTTRGLGATYARCKSGRLLITEM